MSQFSASANQGVLPFEIAEHRVNCYAKGWKLALDERLAHSWCAIAPILNQLIDMNCCEGGKNVR